MTALVTTNWLADHLADSNLVVLDASVHLPAEGRHARSEFAAAHIPGARFLDLKAIAPSPDAPLGSDAHRTLFTHSLGAVGVGNAAQVVFCDDSKLRSSARAWYICRLYGMERISILDGGLTKWRAEDRPIESGLPEIVRTSFDAIGGVGELRTKADMLANLESQAEQVVDARDAARFAGQAGDFRPGVASGHIPGSRNLPFGTLLNTDGTYKSATEIRNAFEQAGVDLSQPVTTTCGSGITASVLLFALDRLGKADTALYDGSWSEWGADPDTPKATGRR